MPKAPAFQFYVKDWLSDPELQCVSASSRGLWIDALCYMWEAPERGKLTATVEELSKLLRATNGDFTQFMEDLKRHKFADVTICNNEVTLLNRRMYREQKERDNTRLRVSRFRSNAKCNPNVTPPSSSPSPSAKKESIKKERKLPDAEWLKELQNKPCYSHLSIQTEFEKCETWFQEREMVVSRKRFLSWINRSQFQTKPIQKEDPYKNYEYVKGGVK